MPSPPPFDGSEKKSWKEDPGQDSFSSVPTRDVPPRQPAAVTSDWVDPPSPETSKFQSTQADDASKSSEAFRLDFLTPSSNPDALGQLRHYQVIHVLGEGGFGIVLKALDEKLQRSVAVKVMSSQAASSASARERFLREARAVAKVRNPHIVQVFEVAESPLPHLVMEYIQGPNLQHEIDVHGPFDVRMIVQIGAQASSGLAAAHAQGLIHRDIKPANILLSGPVGQPGSMDLACVVKISDFGLARAADDVQLTLAGTIAGTPLYMSPEQARGESLDTRSDLFSLGSVLYTLCTGQPAFKADRTVGVLRRVCHDTPRPIRELNPRIPDWLSAFIGSLLAKDPQSRIQTATEVADLLGQFLLHLDDPSQPVPGAPVVSRETTEHRPIVDERTHPMTAAADSRPSRSLLWCGLAIALLFMGFLGGYQFASKRMPPHTETETSSPNVTSAQSANARQLLEQKLSQEPNNEFVAGAVGELMLAESVSSTSGDSDRSKDQLAISAELRKANLRGFAVLGAARFARGDYAGAAESLSRSVEAGSEAGPAEWLLLSLGEWEQKRTDAANVAYQKAMTGLGERPRSKLESLLARRAMIEIEKMDPEAADARLRGWADMQSLATLTLNLERNRNLPDAYEPRAVWFACRGRWKEAANDFVSHTERNPKDLHRWLWAGAALLLAGDDVGHQALCAKMTLVLENSYELWDTEVLCKIWLLHAGNYDRIRDPLEQLRVAVTEDKGEVWLKPWLAGTRSLAAYRSGDYIAAIKCSAKVAEPGTVKPAAPSDADQARNTALAAMAFLVRAMAEKQSAHSDEARRCYDAAVALIPSELQQMSVGTSTGNRALDPFIIDRDWLIAEVLRREAEQVLASNAGNK